MSWLQSRESELELARVSVNLYRPYMSGVFYSITESIEFWQMVNPLNGSGVRNCAFLGGVALKSHEL